MNKKKIIVISVLAVVLLAIVGFVFFTFFSEPIKYEVVSDTKLIGTFDIENALEKSHNIIEKDGEYYLVICYGEQTVFYSTVEVSNVEIKGRAVTVDVNLPKDEGIGEAFSYPKTAIKFDKKPILVDVNYN